MPTYDWSREAEAQADRALVAIRATFTQIGAVAYIPVVDTMRPSIVTRLRGQLESGWTPRQGYVIGADPQFDDNELLDLVTRLWHDFLRTPEGAALRAPR
jgi:hypothetical protein